MNTNLIASLGLAAALVAFGAPVPAQDTKPSPAAEADKVSVPELIEQLGDRAFQKRRAAEAALRARGKEALEDLRKAAKEHSDEEVRWRAERLVKQIESGDAGRLQRRQSDDGARDVAPGPWRRLRFGQEPDLERLFGDVFEQLERDFGIDIPRARFFHDDFFKGLQEQMEELRSGAMPGAGQAFSMRVDENGVRVEITEKDADGKSETRVYEAPDLESFREKYPEVARRYLRDGGVSVFRFGPRGFRAMPSLPGIPEPVPQGELPPPGQRLGVLVEDVPEGVREFLGLAEGHGLAVREVTPGSLAELLGIETGDIVLQINDKQVYGTDDVRAALAEVEAGGSVKVKVNRRGAERTLEAKKPAAEEERRGSGKLERRNGKDGGKGTTIR